MQKVKALITILAMSSSMMIGGCGGSGSGSGSSGPVGTQMGGSRQGSPLNLAGVVTTFASIDGVGTIWGITTDGTNLYFTDTLNNTIRKAVIATGTVTMLAGTAGVAGHDDGAGTAATFNQPTGITTDGINLFVSDSGNNTIRKIVIATGVVTTLAGTPGTVGADNGVGAAALFNEPVGVTTDGKNLYVADDQNALIRKIVIDTREVSTVAGIAGVMGHNDAVGTQATFNDPDDVTTDGKFLYVGDDENNIIRKIDLATGTVSTLAGTAGVAGATNATGTAATFNGPHFLTTDGANIYVAEHANQIIRKIVIATGAVTTVAGTPGVVATQDGTGPNAGFSNPAGITTDGRSLYVVNAGSNWIRKIN